MRWLRVAVLCVLAAGICPLALGCSTGGGPCLENSSAALLLSCGPSDLTAVKLSGPCPPLGDGGVGEYVSGTTGRLVSFGATNAGTCHVTLVFATGYTFAADVTFLYASGGCPGCAQVLMPTTGSIMVNNPNDTCLLPDSGVSSDAGADSGVVDASSN
jgi:hypothetical protein